jgi:hypothetical protein
VAIQSLVVLVVAYYLYRLIADHWDSLRSYPWNIRWDSLFLSLVLGAGATLLLAGCWAISLRMLAAPLTGWPAVRVWMLTNFLKYVPGKVWLLIARYVACDRRGVQGSVFLTSFVYEFFLLIVGGILASAVTVPLWSERTDPSRYWWALPFMLGTLAMLHPRLFGAVTGWALRRLGREPLAANFRWGQILRLTFLFAGAWLVYGLGFAFLTHALWPIQQGDFPALAGFFVLSFALSQIAIITPGGLGIREGVLALLLTQQFPEHPGVGALLAVIARLWTVAAELLALVPVLLMRQYRLTPEVAVEGRREEAG